MTNNVLNILNSNNNISPFNKTFICVVPKVHKLTLPSYVHPIYICNVILKIITKAISNSFKHILNNIIHPNQRAFIPGRLITNNIILTFEAFHTISKNTNTNKWSVGMKLDMVKAYDRLEWPFIEKTLRTMGFPSKLVSIVMQCIKLFPTLLSCNALKLFPTL